MIRVKENKKRKKVGIHVILLSSLLIFITVFGFTLSKTFTNYIEADTNGAIRGQPYDLWADKVLGKRDFTEITPRRVVPDKVSSPGGVIVDRSVSPGRAYIWDSGNSRIMGINLADCYGVGVDERCSAAIVIGQPSATDYGACNQDSSFQYYPNRAPASASTLCGMPEWTHTTLEDKSFTSMYVASNGDLYVADVLNNRVLKYISPFTTDQVADDVWGQADFTGVKCNRLKQYTDSVTPQPNASSLCFLSTGTGGAGVSLDFEGNLWVADGGNGRILRFPNNSGTIAKTADVVIGHANFTTGGDYSGGAALNRVSSPTAIRFDSANNMYVADAGNSRVLKFSPPYTTSMSGSVLIGSDTLTFGVVSIELTPSGDKFWTYEVEDPGAGFRQWDLNGVYQNLHFTNWNPGGGSLGIDTDGNLLVSAYVYQQDVARYSYDSDSDSYIGDQSFFYPPGGYNLTSADRFEQGGWAGIAVAANQLIATDARLMFWNDPLNKSNGQVADGFVGGSSSTDLSPGYVILKADSDNKIYVTKGSSIYVYQAPLTSSSDPITVLTPPFETVTGGSVSVESFIGGLAVTAHGEYLWVSNPDNNRVFRIKDPLTTPRVDIVIGQTSLAGTTCNKGLIPAPNVDGSVSADRSMLCHPGALSLDRHGNLFLSDHFFEIEGNLRLLMFSASQFPAAPASVLFNLSATKEFPRVNNITHFSPSTFEPAFDSSNRMVVGYNPYTGPRFLEYYNNPTAYNPSNRSDPAYAIASGKLNDFMGWTFAMTFDSSNNLYAYDTNRGKILIFKDPFGTAPPIDDDGGGDGGGDYNGDGSGGGGNNYQGGGSNNTGSNYYYAAGNQNPTVTKPTTPVSFVQVNDQTPVVTNNSPDTTQVAIEHLVSNTESNKTISLIMGVFVELAKNSKPEFALNFAGFSLGIFLLIIGIALYLSGANLLSLIPLIVDSLLNRKKQYGGIIYNSVTGLPIALAKVSILRKEATANNNVAAIVVESCLTDLEGRYKLGLLPSRNLSIEVKSLGYEYFVKTLPSNLDVALVPLKENSLIKKLLSTDKNILFKLLRWCGLLAAVWGYIVTIYAQVSNPNSTNLLLIAIYSVLFILATYPSLYSLFLKRIHILDNEGKKLPSAIVRIYQDKNPIDVALTNKKGVAKFNLEEGIYKAVTTKPGFSYHEADIEIGEEGHIKNEIKMMSTNQAETLTSNLDLHDQLIQDNHDKFKLH